MTDLISRDAAIALIRKNAWPDDGTYPPSQKSIETAERVTVDICTSVLRTLPTMQVSVKPLEWKPWDLGVSQATSILGTYYTWRGYWRKPGMFGGMPSDDPEAASQADYEASIRSALSAVLSGPSGADMSQTFRLRKP